MISLSSMIKIIVNEFMMLLIGVMIWLSLLCSLDGRRKILRLYRLTPS